MLRENDLERKTRGVIPKEHPRTSVDLWEGTRVLAESVFRYHSPANRALGPFQR